MTEEATKNALVMPFFAMLGYDVFDTNEFMPEFVCDFGTKKGEKIDYAILKDGEPVMMIEVKRAGAKLQKQQQAQDLEHRIDHGDGDGIHKARKQRRMKDGLDQQIAYRHGSTFSGTHLR